MSISPTFYNQLLRQYSFTKKNTKPNCKYKKLLRTLLYEKAAYKMLVKLTLGSLAGKEFVLRLTKNTASVSNHDASARTTHLEDAKEE